MTNKTSDSSTDFVKPLEQAQSQAERLEGMLAQLVNVMKARGLMFSNAPTEIIASIRQILTTSTNEARKVAGKLQQLQKLVDTSALLTSSLQLDQVLQEVMDTIISLTGAERAYLMLRDNDSAELTIRAARNWDGATLRKEEVSFSRGIVNSALEQKQPILTGNALSDKRFLDMKSITGLVLRSIVCVPLILRGQVIGVLYADNRLKEETFGADVVPMLTAFGNQAAIAIENARLFQQVKTDLDKAQREVQTLRIQIDQKQADSQIDEIVGSDIFKRLAGSDKPSPDQ